MGHENNLACLDCRVSYYLGDGSYGNTIWANTLEKFDSRVRTKARNTNRDPLRLGRNLSHRIALMLHRGHRCQQWTDDDPWDDGDWDEEVDLLEIIEKCYVCSVSEIEQQAVEVDRKMTEHGRTHHLEARQLVMMEVTKAKP
jgi:hypothetical protein